ncbi:hypothetical protein AA0313_2878 [Acetobacter indonesiensis NRIC 0313]|uniref:hypothetical protein n=1 Tax=Acetobacter indonesiensis TaxID=104101 RepID=UPI000662AE4D|nr:hypothetical protein [Acetobacter indonesiensis]GBQ62034.1 hypothetical protein AA0313_2878 [Acetobacter indonesiensis NRIC 0313]
MKKIWDFVGLNEKECFFITNKEYDNKIIFPDDLGYEFHNIGFSISVDYKSSVIKNVFFFSKYYGKKYKEYKGELPLGITFDMNQDSVRKKMGIPNFTRGSFQSIIGFMCPLDSYFIMDKKYSIEYLPDLSGIKMICAFVDI